MKSFTRYFVIFGVTFAGVLAFLLLFWPSTPPEDVVKAPASVKAFPGASAHPLSAESSSQDSLPTDVHAGANTAIPAPAAVYPPAPPHRELDDAIRLPRDWRPANSSQNATSLSPVQAPK